MAEQVGAIIMPIIAHANYNGIASSSAVAICNLALALEAVYTRQFRADFASSGPKTERICGSPRAEPTACLINYIAACPDPQAPSPLVTLENVDRNKRVMAKSFSLSLNPSRTYHIDLAVRKGNFVGLMGDVKHHEGDSAGLDVLCVAACKFLYISPIIVFQSDCSSFKFIKLQKNDVTRTIEGESFESVSYSLDRWSVDENPIKMRPYGRKVHNLLNPFILKEVPCHHAQYIHAVMQVVDRLQVQLGSFDWGQLAATANNSMVLDYVFGAGMGGSQVIPYQKAFLFTADMDATWDTDMYTIHGHLPLADVSNFLVSKPPACPALFVDCKTVGDVCAACCKAQKPQDGMVVPSFFNAHLLPSNTTVQGLLEQIDKDMGTFRTREIRNELAALRNMIENAVRDW